MGKRKPAQSPALPIFSPNTAKILPPPDARVARDECREINEKVARRFGCVPSETGWKHVPEGWRTVAEKTTAQISTKTTMNTPTMPTARKNAGKAVVAPVDGIGAGESKQVIQEVDEHAAKR